MTILDFNSAMNAYQKLRAEGASTIETVRQLFRHGYGRIELVKAVEKAERLPPSDSRKIVTKALTEVES